MRDNKGRDEPNLEPTPSTSDLNKKIEVPEHWLNLILTKYWWVFITAAAVVFLISCFLLFLILQSLQSDIHDVRFELKQDINRQIDLLRGK